MLIVLQLVNNVLTSFVHGKMATVPGLADVLVPEGLCYGCCKEFEQVISALNASGA